MREGADAKARLYAKFCPVRALSQDDLCRRMEQHNRKYTDGEYRMILEEAIDTIADELRSGNTVTLPKLGLFSLGIGGAFDPSGRTEFRKHPIRAQLRFASAFNDSFNKGAMLKRLDALPVCARMSSIAYSVASPEGATRWEGGTMRKAVLPEAMTLGMVGEYRNLPEGQAAELQELSLESGAPLGEAVAVPVSPEGDTSRKSTMIGMITAEVSAVSPRFLPGTVWRLRIVTGNEEPGELTFTVADVPRRKDGE